jgi:hypothetical protein
MKPSSHQQGARLSLVFRDLRLMGSGKAHRQLRETNVVVLCEKIPPNFLSLHVFADGLGIPTSG